MKNFLFLSILLISGFGFGQAPVIEWEKSLGGSSSDLATSVQQTSDGGYIVAGWSYSNDNDVSSHIGYFDCWLVKLDGSGAIEWEKSLGGSLNENPMSIKQTTDGGYIFAGGSMSNDGDLTTNNGEMDYWVVRLDPAGNILWQKAMGGSDEDQATAVGETNDGGFIVAGHTKSNDGDIIGHHGGRDVWIIKFDASGNVLWKKTLGGSGYEYAESIVQTNDGGYIFCGGASSTDGDVTENNGLTDCWIVKLNNLGDIEWQKSHGGTENDNAQCIKQTVDGGYIFVGSSQSDDGDILENNGSDDCLIVKLDPTGNITWQEIYGGTNEDVSNLIKEIPSGGYLVSGWTRSDNGDIMNNNGFYDYWVFKLDTFGYMTWSKTIGGSGLDKSSCAAITSDGGYILIGESASDNGDVSLNHGSRDYWVVKLGSVSTTIKNQSWGNINKYPNPTSNTFTITADKVINSSFKIVDAQGKDVLSGKMKGKEQTIDISSLSKGTYSIVFEDEELPVLSVIKD